MRLCLPTLRDLGNGFAFISTSIQQETASQQLQKRQSWLRAVQANPLCCRQQGPSLFSLTTPPSSFPWGRENPTSALLGLQSPPCPQGHQRRGIGSPTGDVWEWQSRACSRDVCEMQASSSSAALHRGCALIACMENIVKSDKGRDLCVRCWAY